jgi:hypothetical protein
VLWGGLGGGASRGAPGSTTEEDDRAERDGVTHVRLTHRGLEAALREMHAGGWEQYLARLAAAAEGREPARDPAAAHAATGRPPMEAP